MSFAFPVMTLAASLAGSLKMPSGEFCAAEKLEVNKYTGSEENFINDNFASLGAYYGRPSLLKLLGGSRKVILTFDDGPHPRTTPQVLEILRRRNVKAIFFVLGLQAQKFPELVKQIYDEGHIIGNHSFGHKNLAQLSEEKLREEIGKTSRLIESITGKRPEYLRPPYGAMNKNVLRVAQSEGMKIVLWTVDPKDWQSKNEIAILKSLDRQLGFNNGDFRGGAVLLHDIYPSTVRALQPMLDRMATHEYLITSIDKLDAGSAGFWAAASPSLLRSSFFYKAFDPEVTGNQLLVSMFKKKPRVEKSHMAILKAHKSGNLLAYLIKNHFNG